MGSEMAGPNGRWGVGSPWVVLLLVFGVFAARWVWDAAGIWDYAWTYDPAWRILHGQIPYRDFVYVEPPLAPYLLAALMKVFGQSLWTYLASLYLSWLGSLAVGIAILGVLGASREIKVLSVIVAGTLSAPFSTSGREHSYQGPMCAGLVILFLLRYRRSANAWDVFWAGVFTGITVVARQNIGVPFGLAVTLLLLLPRPLGLGMQDARLLNVLRFLAGGTAGLLPIMGYFFSNAGFQEVIREMFLDAAAGKGGIYNVVLRGFPRLIIDPGIPHRRSIELLMAIAVLLFVGCVTYAAIGRTNRSSNQNGVADTHRNSSKEANTRTTLYFGCFFVVALAAMVVTLFDLPQVRTLLVALHLRFFMGFNWSEVAIQAVYLAASGATLAALFGIMRKRVPGELALPCILLLVLAYANATSHLSLFGFAAPVVIPILLFVMHAAGLQNLVRRGVATAIVYLIIACLFPTWAHVFCPLYPLPGDSPFSGLYADSDYGRSVTELWRNVTPQIRGQRTLWFQIGGPLPAYEGIPVVPSVAIYYPENFNTRLEERLWKAWHLNPPAYVILSRFIPTTNAVLFRKDSIESWLSSEYTEVWQGQETHVTLWKKRE
jgi:hypothetical protein